MTLYSGDDFYGDEITSPLMQPNTQRPLARDNDAPLALGARALSFDAWTAKLDAICWRKIGCSLDDLEDYCTYDAWDDGMTPMQFYRETIAPDVEE
jgi:hypothetical protein